MNERLSNVAAFEMLENEITEKGRVFTRGEISIGQSGNTEISARGIEKDVSVDLAPTILGELSIRALVAEPLTVDSFSSNDDRFIQAQWLIRSRLTFYMPNRNDYHVIPGKHMVGAAYLLTRDAPEFLDNRLERALQIDDEEAIRRHVSVSYHQLPDIPDVSMPKSKRSNMIRSWLRTTEVGGMAMLSPITDGEVSSSELPKVISWLVN